MISDYTKAVGQLQELFQELADQGKISPEQAEQFDHSQKVLINFHAWVQNQLDGNIKVELPWDDPRFTEVWKLWKDFKKQQFNFAYKAIGEQGALKDLADLSHGDMGVAIQIIYQSIKKGWKGFFAIRSIPGNEPVGNRNMDYKQQLLNRMK